MPRYFIQLSFKGTHYHGWQIQNNAPSVQAEIQKCLSIALQSDIEIIGAGRTDAAVHAKMMVAHFDFDTNIDVDQLVYKLNNLLANNIAIQKIVEVASDLHARFSAISRSYEYHIHSYKNPFKENRSYYFNLPLDIEKMNEAAEILLQYTDFSAFSKSKTQTFTNDCKIIEAYWIHTGEELIFNITANRFLRNMVRAIVGTLMDIGLNKISIQEFKKIIESKNRSNAGTSVPACGLYLTQVKYPLDVFN